MGAPSRTVTAARATRWPTMVLAHNEGDHIEACLDSLYAGEPPAALTVFVSRMRIQRRA